MSGHELQVTVFNVGDEEYAVDILRVRAIERLTEVTHVPHAPDFVDGVINLRGKIVPVVDLRKRFGLQPKEADKSTKIIVVESGDEAVGFKVDGVREVLRIPHSDTEPPPDIATQNADYIERLAKLDDRLILVLDVDRVLSPSEQKELHAVSEVES